MSDLDKKIPPPKGPEGVDKPKSGESTDEVIAACQTPKVARALTTHFLGGYYAAVVPTVLRKRDGWEQLIAGAIEDITKNLGQLGAQMNKKGHPDIGSRIKAISDLVAQPITEEINAAVRIKDEELRKYVESKES